MIFFLFYMYIFILYYYYYYYYYYYLCIYLLLLLLLLLCPYWCSRNTFAREIAPPPPRKNAGTAAPTPFAPPLFVCTISSLSVHFKVWFYLQVAAPAGVYELLDSLSFYDFAPVSNAYRTRKERWKARQTILPCGGNFI